MIVAERKPFEEITEKEVASYYKSDRLLWSLFLAFRRIDRGLRAVTPMRRYEFILPGRIKR